MSGIPRPSMRDVPVRGPVPGTVLDQVFGLADVDDRGIADGRGHDLAWGQVADAVRRTATLLQRYGVRPGSRVAGFLDSGLDPLLGWWGANLLGATWAPLNRGLGPDGLRRQLRELAPAAVVTHAADAATVRAAVTGAAVFTVDGQADGTVPFAAAGLPAWGGPEPTANDPAMILFSSGTTGDPKGCVLGHGYLMNFARLGLQNVPRDTGDTTWCPLPMFHLAGLAHVIAAAMTGGRLVLASRFSVSGFWRDVTAADATIATLMSSMIPRIARADYAEIPAHRLRRVTGEPFPPVLQALWRTRFGVAETGSTALGQTEAGFLTTLRGHAYRPGTCGLATDSFELAVLDEDGQRVGPDQVGELVCRPTRAHAMFDGYLGQPPHDVRPGGDQYWHTGDLVRRDADGYVYFVDRRADRIRKGGENVASAQIEAAALSHPLVGQAAAVGLPAEADDRIMLVVTAADGAELDAEQLHDWVTGRLPRFAVPEVIDIVDALPVNATGKVRKQVLRERGARAQAWTTGARC